MFERPGVWSLVVLLLAVTVFLGKNESDRLTRDPVLYAAVARQMAEGGDLVVPRFGDEVYLRKPPLMFWLSAGAMRVLGAHGHVARLPSLLFGIISVLLAFHLARRLADRETAFLTALILVSTYTFLRGTRTVRMESIICATTLGALLVYLRGTERARFPWWGGLAFFGLMAVGTLGKGYAGLLPLPIVLLGIPRRKAIRSLRFWAGALLFILVVGGWLFLVYRRLGADWTLALGSDLDEYGGTQGRLAMFLKKIPWGFAKVNVPWSPFVLIGILIAVRDLSRGSEAAQRRARILLAWIAVVIAVIIPKEYQFTRYLAPVTPALAILAAVPIRGFFVGRSFAPLVAGVAGCLAVVAFFFLLVPIDVSGDPHRYTAAASTIVRVVPEGEPLPYFGRLTDTRRATIYFYSGRHPVRVRAAEIEAMRGTGRAVFVEGDRLNRLPKTLTATTVFEGEGYVILRLD